MGKIKYTLVSLLLACACSLLQAQPTVIISELFYDVPGNEAYGTDGARNGEFVTLYNYGNAPVNLSGWSLWCAGNDDARSYALPAGTVLQPQKHITVAYRHRATNSFSLQSLFPFAPADKNGTVLYQHLLILNNNGPRVSLLSAPGMVHDEVHYSNRALHKDTLYLEGHNGKGKPIEECLSLQRVNVTTRNGKIVYRKSDYVVDRVSMCNFVSMFMTVNGLPAVGDAGAAMQQGGGIADVSPTGAATYSLPIEATFGGQGGLAPTLAISYNSQAGNGLLGWGFSVAGAYSSAVRVPHTVYLNGSAKPINYDTPWNNESFSGNIAIDGNTLRHVSENELYTEYCFENNNFSKITIRKGMHTDRAIRVEDKNGTTYTYGYRYFNDQHTINGGATVVEWLLNNVKDTKGNTMSYTYKYDKDWYPSSDDKEYAYVKEIEYTYGKVSFNYEPRPDTVLVQISGKHYKMNWRLKNLEVYAREKETLHLQKTYEFTYTTDLYSRLTKIEELNEVGKRLPVSAFAWRGYPTGTEMQHATVSGIPDAQCGDRDSYSYQSADMNGDGLQDLIEVKNIATEHEKKTYYNKKLILYQASKANGSVVLQKTAEFELGVSDGIQAKIGIANPGAISSTMGEAEFSSKGLFTADLYGTGEQELVSCIATQWRSYNLSRGGTEDKRGLVIFRRIFLKNGFLDTVKIHKVWRNGSYTVPVADVKDIDNDGKSELIFLSKEEGQKMALLNIVGLHNDGKKRVDSMYISLNPENPSRMIVSDFDGDGLQDILLVDKVKFFILWNKGGGMINAFSNAYKSSYYTFNNDYRSIEIGDFNGDGLPDFILNEHCNDRWHIAINDGNRNFRKTLLGNIKAVEEDFTDRNDDSDRCMVVDFDGDGKSDLIISDSEYEKKDDIWSKPWGEFKSHYVYWYRSTGAGFELKYKREYNSEDDGRKFSNFAFGDFDGDGHVEMLHYGVNCYNYKDRKASWRMYKNMGLDVQSGKLLAVANSTGSLTTFTYNSLANTSSYSHAATAPSYPVIQVRPAIPLVTAMKIQVGRNASSTTFTYKGIRLHVAGKGFLGFEQVSSTCGEANKQVVQTYGLHPTYYLPYLKQQKICTANGQPISTTANVFDAMHFGRESVFGYTKRTVTTDHLAGTTVTRGYEYSGDGNIIRDTTDYGNNVKRVKLLGYHNTFKGLLTTVEQHSYRGSATDRFESFQRLGYNSKGMLILHKSYLENSDRYITTEYQHLNALGLPQTIQKYATGTEKVDEKLEYDALGRITKSTNAIGQSTTYSYYASGRLHTQTDHLENTTTYVYDAYGRLQKTYLPTGEELTTAWAAVSNTTPDAPPGAMYACAATSNDGSSQTTFYDARNLTLRTVSVSALGKKVYADTEYDHLGRTARQSLPYYAGQAKRWVVTTYDQYGRLASENNQGLPTTYRYEGLTTTVTGPDGKATATTRNAAGDVLHSTDPAGNTVNYEYHPSGQPAKITAAGATYRMEYDRWGRQIKLHDPNAGTISYRYDAWGRLQGQTNANGYTDSLVYDELGRTVQKISPEATYAYHYNSYGLASVTRNGVREYGYQYDNLGRTTADTTYINSTGYIFTYKYNTLGQLYKKTYPDGFTLGYTYANGWSTAITSSGGATLWQLQEENAMGQPLKYGWGNGQSTTLRYNAYGQLYAKTATGQLAPQGYSFSPQTGNLSDRTLAHKKEDFQYDNLDRLTVRGAAGCGSDTVTYAPNGNISFKNNVGAYAYSSSKPHAITDIINPSTKLDAAMRQEQRIAYDSKNRPTHIAQGADSLTFYYDHTGQRLYTKYYKSGTLHKTTHYVGSYEKEIYADSARTRCFIGAPTGLLVVREESYPISMGEGYGKSSLLYTHTDHLGSIVGITDAIGTLLYEYSYDPWGNLRNPQTLKLYDLDNIPTLRLGRGFTGHEHLPEFGLINMNARLYDPTLGRFLSPDPYVTSAGYSQDFNRYSYARNNPLCYADPTGKNPIIIAAIFGAFVNTAMAHSNGAKGHQLFLAMGVGALAGASGAYVGGLVAGAYTFGGFAGGTLIGAAGGAAGGFVGGAGNAWINGASIGSGLMAGLVGGGIGALAGGLLGGLTRGVVDYQNGYDFWDGGQIEEFAVSSTNYEEVAQKYNASDIALNDEYLQSRMKGEFGIGKGDFKIKDITTQTGKSYGMTSSGKYINLETRSTAGGYVERFTSGHSKIHISYHYTFADAVDFKAIAGHELIHAYHNYLMPGSNYIRPFSERAAYKYSYEVYMSNGRYASALSIQKTAIFNSAGSFWGAYPPQYQVPSPLKFY